MDPQFLWYIPNTVEPGHRGDPTTEGWGSLEFSTGQARALEAHGWGGALLGTSWGRPDTFTVATAVAALTTSFKPLIAIRPGYWQPAHFASAAATLDQLTRGRVLINIVTGLDNLAAYGDGQADPAQRYDRTREFLRLVRQLWTQENVTFRGVHFQVDASTLAPRPYRAAEGRHPTLYFGGASEAAQRVSATEADVQLFWGEPLDGVAERIDLLKALSESLGREHAPLQFGLRITTVVRDTAEEAWRDAKDKVAKMAANSGEVRMNHYRRNAVGQQRLLGLASRGEVLDSCLYTTPGKYGGGGAATTWLVGSPDDVAAALKKYQELGITHFVLSDTPYQQEIIRVGDQLLPLLREPGPLKGKLTVPRQLHLNVNILNAGVFGGSWRFPGTDGLASYTIEHYTSIAKKAESAKLDAVFLADGPVVDPNIRHRPNNNLEPTTVLARIAAQTGQIGLIGTLSSSYNDPIELARRLGDLDYISGGRLGWNVVTTAGAAAARNFGRSAEPDHALRYRRAAAFTQQVVAHWDARTGLASPQGRPVVVQAGGSSDGRQLASRVGEVIFSADQDIDHARAFRTEIRNGAVRFGRRPEDIVILPGLSTVLGGTEEEARRRRKILDEILPDAYARRRLSGQLGISLEGLSDAEPIPAGLLVEPDQAGGSQTFYRVVKAIIDKENPTLGQLLRKLSGGGGHRIVVGTPEQVADDMERWFRHGAADGFNLMPDVLPSGFDDVADQLIPELQRRGLFRSEYAATTLRGHLGLNPPAQSAVPREAIPLEAAR